MKTAHSHSPLRVLFVEDSENDALLLEHELRRAGHQTASRRVDTPEALAAALEEQEWDVVIADYVLPRFNGLAALAMVKERGLDLPFIIVSGHITEDTAVAAMKAGAHDYVMKDKPARLGSAIERELREAEVRHARRLADKRLWEEHAFRRAIEDSIPSGISVVDLDGAQTYVNPAFCQMVGWSENELIGRHAPFPYWPREEMETITAALEMVAAGQAPPGGLELRLSRKDASRFDALLLVTPLRDSFGEIKGWLSSITDVTQRKQAEDALRRSHEELEQRVRERTADLSAANAQLQAAMAERRRLEHELLEITEKERRRIGLDLHDDLGQRLSGIALMAKGLQNKLSRQGFSDSADAGRIYELVQSAMTHARDLAHDLATLDFQEKDLPTALKDLAEHTRKAFQIACNFQSAKSVPPLESTAVMQLYKITQEALTNAIKHGKTRDVGIHLSNGGTRLVLTVRNDGISFPSVVSRNAGMGLRIMNYRASLIGASLDIKPGTDSGTVVTCSVPLGKTAGS